MSKDDNIRDLMRNFLIGEIFSCTISASFSRNRVYYNDSVTDNEKIEFKDSIKRWLDELVNKYNNRECISSENIIENINSFANDLSNKHGNILDGNRFRIGTAQKLINVYLKYLWVIREIDEPPLCPLDGVVLNKLDEVDNWTELDDLDRYKELIQIAQNKAKEEGFGSHIARWELKVWQNRL